jgi:16S rRNA (cytidine1402-2'-O)-methyltransferase
MESAKNHPQSSRFRQKRNFLSESGDSRRGVPGGTPMRVEPLAAEKDGFGVERLKIEGGSLYIVATPIGNMADMTERGRAVLAEASAVYAEDTRVTGGLLKRYGISTQLRSYREAADRRAVEKTIVEVIERLKKGEVIACVSDAGTPGVSDPGDFLVKRVVEAGFKVVPVPGPSALASILSVAGLAVARPLFLGFLPKKKGRQTLLRQVKEGFASGVFDGVVIYESPERIVATLDEFASFEMPLAVCLGRELTKMYEEILRGTPAEVAETLRARHTIKGEIVVLIAHE